MPTPISVHVRSIKNLAPAVDRPTEHRLLLLIYSPLFWTPDVEHEVDRYVHGLDPGGWLLSQTRRADANGQNGASK